MVQLYHNRNVNKNSLLFKVDYTSTWTAKVTIAFPDYNSFEHREAVLMAKSSFENADFVNSIEVITYKPDFRDEVI